MIIRMALALLLMAPLGACDQVRQVTAVTDDYLYPALRTADCALAPALSDARQAERYARSGVYFDADCDWKPGDTLDDYWGRVLRLDGGVVDEEDAGVSLTTD